MRIDESAGSTGPAQPLQHKPADPQRSSRKAEGLNEGPEAEVQLSNRAREIQRAKQIAGGVPEVRKEKVAEFRQLIAQGAYRVDSRELARRILEELRGR